MLHAFIIKLWPKNVSIRRTLATVHCVMLEYASNSSHLFQYIVKHCTLRDILYNTDIDIFFKERENWNENENNNQLQTGFKNYNLYFNIMLCSSCYFEQWKIGKSFSMFAKWNTRQQRFPDRNINNSYVTCTFFG